MPRKRPTVLALARQIQAARKELREIKRELVQINEKLAIEPKDAIGFQFVPPDEDENEDDDE